MLNFLVIHAIILMYPAFLGGTMAMGVYESIFFRCALSFKANHPSRQSISFSTLSFQLDKLLQNVPILGAEYWKKNGPQIDTPKEGPWGRVGGSRPPSPQAWGTSGPVIMGSCKDPCSQPLTDKPFLLLCLIMTVWGCETYAMSPSPCEPSHEEREIHPAWLKHKASRESLFFPHLAKAFFWKYFHMDFHSCIFPKHKSRWMHASPSPMLLSFRKMGVFLNPSSTHGLWLTALCLRRQNGSTTGMFVPLEPLEVTVGAQGSPFVLRRCNIPSLTESACSWLQCGSSIMDVLPNNIFAILVHWHTC